MYNSVLNEVRYSAAAGSGERGASVISICKYDSAKQEEIGRFNNLFIILTIQSDVYVSCLFQNCFHCDVPGITYYIDRPYKTD